MLMSLFNVMVMGALFVYMVSKAKYATARRMALIPLCVCGVEMLVFGLLQAELFPALTAVLAVLRLVIALCCVKAMRRDAAIARQRARRARQQRREALHPVAMPVPVAAARCA